jgi:hypothetical protein
MVRRKVQVLFSQLQLFLVWTEANEVYMGSRFEDRSQPPTAASLSRELGRAKVHWDTLESSLATDWPDLTLEWKFYGGKYGWQLKVSRKRRAVLYMLPGKGSFVAALALKGRALSALVECGLPASLVDEILSAKEYPEGRPARVVVTSAQKVRQVQRLISLKLES